MKTGPRGWIFGNTEENGWMFILDPSTMQRVIWNAGRTAPKSGARFEGDITDFVVWEEKDNSGQPDRMVILACQAYPAEIYRYDVTLPTHGLPDMAAQNAQRVYANSTWKRVMSIESGLSASGERMILAGANGKPELIRSVDDGITWLLSSIFDGGSDLDSTRHADKLTSVINFAQIRYISDTNTWFLLLRNAFLLESESPWPQALGYRHTVNGVLYSNDFGVTWKVAKVAPDATMPTAVQQSVDADKAANRLHPNLYGMVGEAGQSLIEMDSGRLVMSTSIANTPEDSFGGRILFSDDGGQTWNEKYHFTDFRDIEIISLGGNTLLAGTATKSPTLPPGGMAFGDVRISYDGGASFSLLTRVVESNQPSKVRADYYVTGVASMVATAQSVFIGTVDESGYAQVFTFQRRDPPFIVNTTSDSNDGTCSVAHCSLREAINAANSDGNDSIIGFDSTIFGAANGPLTIQLSSVLPSLDSNILLQGPGANLLMVRGEGASDPYRIFTIGSGKTVTIFGLTIASGWAGGSTFPGNSGGGILNDQGTLTVSSCTFRGNAASGSGGGLSNSGGTITEVSDCTFDGNSAGLSGGGMMHDNGTALIRNCTFWKNTAFTSGGAVQNEAGLAVMNCTLSGNTSTSAQGGGIFNDSGTVSLNNTLFNAGASGANLVNNGGVITSQGYNLSDDNGGGFLNKAGDQVNAATLLDAAGLSDNGGPTKTIALQSGSPAINAGNPAFNGTGEFDQRRGGFARVQGGRLDIGAFEAPDSTQSGAALVVNTRADHDDGVCGTGDCTLREAINAANARAGDDSVSFNATVFAPDTGPHTIQLTHTLPNLNTNIQLNGPGANVLTVRGEGAVDPYRIFTASNGNNGPTIGISHLSIANGSANSDYSPGSYGGYGGSILNDRSVLAINNCTLRDNTASNSGGSLANVGDGGAASMTVSDSTITNSSAAINGGAVYNFSLNNGSATLTVRGSTFNGNSAKNGGGFDNDGGANGNTSLTINNSTLEGNSASLRGGAIFNSSSGGNASLIVGNCTLAGNSAVTSGGGIFNNKSAGSAMIQLSSTILKAGSGGVNLSNNKGIITSQGYNLSNDSSGGFLTAVGDQINIDPKLGPLQNNGGPTKTMALLAGSPAIDKGKSFGATTDQRGLARPYDNPAIANATGGDGSDIGAFEAQFAPTLAVNNPRSLPEGSASSPGSVTFDITLSAASTQTVTVNYETANGTNNPALAGSDYTSKKGKLTFASGETLKRVTISFIGDSTVELNETFFFDLLTPTNATIADSRGVGQINNDDGPGITINNPTTINEGNAGTSSQIFTVTLSAASTETITVNWTTADNTAKASTDYVAASGTLTFTPGETSKNVAVLVKGDSTGEAHETYKVVLSKVIYAFIADGTGIGTIRNDDAAALLFENDAPSP